MELFISAIASTPLPQPLIELNIWLESFRRIWDERLDHLDAYLSELQEKEKNHGYHK
jgi:hypothetical protein